MSASYNHYVKNNLDVAGVITVSSSIDMLNAGTLQIGQTNATKLELAKTGITTEMKGPTNALEGLTITGASTISTTLAVGQATAPDASSILELVSTTKGMLFPRMTTTQRNAIVSPATGLMVYDTILGALYYYNGTVWTMLSKNKIDGTNLIVGEGSGMSLTTGNLSNVLIGRNAGPILTDSSNVFIGDIVATNATTALGNVSIGKSSAVAMTIGDHNTLMGYGCAPVMSTGSYNTFIGDLSGSVVSTGANNTMLGASTAGNSAFNNQTALGYQATSTLANQVMIGNSSVIEMVPNASSNANLGTAANPWNDLYIKGGVTSTTGTFNGVNIVNLSNSIPGSLMTVTSVSTATYTILSTDTIISSKYSTTGAQTLTLPLSSTIGVGKTYHIVDAGGNASTYNITINRSGPDTINGDTSVLINANYQSVSIYNDGSSKWFIY